VSYSLDLNVLLYASDQSSDRHLRARRFIESCAAGPQILCLTWPTLMSYLRIATHPRIFSAPLSPDEALGNVSALIGLPHVRAVSELDGFVDAYIVIWKWYDSGVLIATIQLFLLNSIARRQRTGS
jgi:predicted nucleic acid-binding protein